MEDDIKKPYKGLVTDTDPLAQPKGSYRYAKNAVVENTDGQLNTLATEEGNEECWSLGLGFFPIGKVYMTNGEVVIFATNGTISTIGVVRNCNYEEVVRSSCLNFDYNFAIDTVFRVREGCERVIYFTDGLNPVRFINLDSLRDFYTQDYLDFLDNPIGEFNDEKFDCNLFKLFPEYKLPCFANAEIIPSGVLKSGSYNFAIQLLDSDLNPTPWLSVTNPINIYADDIFESYRSIEGSSNLDSDAAGGISGTTNKAIRLTIEELDDRFKYYRIAVIEASSFAGEVVNVVVSPEIEIGNKYFIYDGSLNGYTEGTIEELQIEKLDVETAEHIEQLENRLILANTKSKQIQYCNFQKFASKIYSKYVVKEVPSNLVSELGNPKNPFSPFSLMGFMGGEVYAFGIVYVFNDGTESPVFHIPGRAKDTIYDSSTETCSVVDDSSVQPWSSNIAHLYSETEYDLLDISDKVEKWRVKETAIKETDLGGQMAYWECRQSVYPNIYNCDSDYWGVDACGNNLEGSPIRHHRFPSRTLEPHVDNDGALTTVIAIKVEVEADPEFQSQIYTLDITYDFQGNSKSKSKNINGTALNFIGSTSTTVTFAIEIGDISDISNIVITNTYSELTVGDPYIEVVDARFTEDSTLRLLGIEFENIEYPHEDIVGHYFVRAERDSFNRTIIDSGIAGRMREKSLDNNYISFSYFTANNNSTEHHYILSPKFMYKGEVIKPDYLKSELAFDFQSKNLGISDYDGVGGFIKDIDTLIETRVQNYSGTINSGKDTNHAVQKYLISDGLSYDDNYEANKRQFNLSYTNRIQVSKLQSPLDKNVDDLEYVTLRVERDVHCNLNSISYYKMHNCIYDLNSVQQVYGGDVYISHFTIGNTLMREVYQTVLGSIISAIVIIGAAVATVATAGAGAGLLAGAAGALGLSVSSSAIATSIVVGAIAAGAIGVTATGVQALYRFYSETDLDEMAEDVELDSLVSKTGSFVAYANELIVGAYVETELNVALRQRKTDECGEFYNFDISVGDYFRNKIMYYDQEKEKWLQKGVPCPEVYHVNRDFDRMNLQKAYFPLDSTYDCCTDCLEKYPTRIHYSEQSFQEELTDNYRNFLVNNYRDIEANHGSITGIIRKQNNLFVLTEESLWQVPQNIQQSIVNELVTFIGTGEYFSIPPRKVLDSDMGSAGTIDKESIVKSPIGVSYFSQREKTFYLLGAQGLERISDLGIYHWCMNNAKDYLYEQMKKNFGIEIKKNPYSIVGAGLHSIYDSELKRIIFTKKDYLIKDISSLTIVNSLLELSNDSVFFYSIEDQFFGVGTINNYEILFSDNSDYFENKSFTISFSIQNKSWVSFHSYLPNFYYSDQNHFYSFNFKDSWKHNIRGVYNTYYGNIEKHIVELVTLKNPLQTEIWNDIIIQSKAYKYLEPLKEFVHEREITFNSVLLYNSRQTSGELIMISKNKVNPQNDYLSQQVINSLNSIIVDNQEENFTLNDFRDFRTDQFLPMFTNNWEDIKNEYPIDKIPNYNVIDYNKPWFELESFRDKYLIIRLSFDNFGDIKLTTNFVIPSSQQSFR